MSSIFTKALELLVGEQQQVGSRYARRMFPAGPVLAAAIREQVLHLESDGLHDIHGGATAEVVQQQLPVR